MEEVAATIDVSNAVAMINAAPAPQQQQQQQQEFKWTPESCLLLLHEYDLLKDKFKDRKNKKKDLWAEISLKFKKIYDCDLEWNVAYKKFRNLKQTFEQVRVKLNQQAMLGQVSSRPKWPYYDKFVQILDDHPGSYGYSESQQLPVEHYQQQQQQQQEANEQHIQMELHHHQQQQQLQMQQQQQQQVDLHHHLHHHHHGHPHPQSLDPSSLVGQELGAEEFTESLVTVFPMGEELEIPAHQSDGEVDGASPPLMEEIPKTEDDDDDDGEEGGVMVVPMQGAVAEGQEDCEEQEDEEVQDEMEPPHRKRYRRRTTSYQQERLEIEREKLHTLREIQRGIECKNDILQGILHVLQAKVWQGSHHHPASNE